ncbi:TPA: hypothetical protein ACF67X_004322 [Salmonella enterica]|nr:hypothetical protein [Salmonella enterica]
MLITLELLLCSDLRRSLLTLGCMTVEQKPALERAISDYTDLYATTPPGVWVRDYKSRSYLTQSVPALPFFQFLMDWRHIHDVPRFIDAHSRHIKPMKDSPGMCVNVWIGWPDGPDSLAVAAELSVDDYNAEVA